MEQSKISSEIKEIVQKLGVLEKWLIEKKMGKENGESPL